MGFDDDLTAIEVARLKKSVKGRILQSTQDLAQAVFLAEKAAPYPWAKHISKVLTVAMRAVEAAGEILNFVRSEAEANQQIERFWAQVIWTRTYPTLHAPAARRLLLLSRTSLTEHEVHFAERTGQDDFYFLLTPGREQRAMSWPMLRSRYEEYFEIPGSNV
jgi:hypothetical protein